MIQSLSDTNLLQLLFDLGILLITARFLGELAKRIKLPAVAGELFAGILLGQSVLHYIAPSISNSLFPATGIIPLALDVLKEVSLAVLVFMTGFELQTEIIRKQIKQSVTVGIFGITIPLGIGFVCAYFFPTLLGKPANTESVMIFAIFIGISMCITALPVLAKILFDTKLINTRIGNIILSAAVIDDLVGWCLFSLLIAFITQSGTTSYTIFHVLIVFIYILFSLLAGIPLLNKSYQFLSKFFNLDDAMITLFFVACFLFAGLTTFLGVHSLIGAFVTGVMLGNCNFINEKTKKMFVEIGVSLFSPLAFSIIALSINFVKNFDLLLVLIFLLLAVISKFTGVFFASKCINRFPTNDSLAIASGMTARGMIEVLLATRALHFAIINENLFVAIVIMAFVTSYLSGIGLRLFSR